MTQRARSLIIKTKGDLMIQVAFIILALVLALDASATLHPTM